MHTNGYEEETLNRIRAKRTSQFLKALTMLLVMYGLVCLYSASFSYCESKGYSPFAVCLNQIVYIAIGVALFAIVLVLKSPFFRFLSPFLLFASIVCWILLAMNVIQSTYAWQLFISTEVADILFLSAYMGKRENMREKKESVFLPEVLCLVIVLLMTYTSGVRYSFLFLITTLILMVSYGAPWKKMLVYFFICCVPVICYFLSHKELIDEALKFISGMKSGGKSGVTVLNAFASGSLSGTGFGHGAYKYEFADSIFKNDILVNMAEELGFAGVFVMLLVFTVLAVTGFSVSSRLYKAGLYLWSDVSMGSALILMSWFLIAFLQCIGLVPSLAGSLPFFSYGGDIICAMVFCALLVRANSELTGDVQEKEGTQSEEKEF